MTLSFRLVSPLSTTHILFPSAHPVFVTTFSHFFRHLGSCICGSSVGVLGKCSDVVVTYMNYFSIWFCYPRLQRGYLPPVFFFRKRPRKFSTYGRKRTRFPPQ
jgi:hypothetical protein